MASKISIRSISFFIALVGAIWAWMVHSSNLKYYQAQRKFIPMDMILTADDASYLAPAYNFYHGKPWKDNSSGVSSYVQRPPMIGMINWVFLHFTESGNYQKYLATCLHGLALFLFGLMCMDWFGKKAGIALQVLYALLPCFWGYLFYFLTESITPSLLIFLVYGFYKFQQKNSPKWLLVQAFIISILLLTRPQLAILILPFFYFLRTYVKNKFHHRWLTVFVSLVIAFGGFAAWQIRSVSIAGGWNGIHPIYHTSNISEYRPVHRSFGNLFRIWEHNGEKFHGIMGKFRYHDSGTPDATDMALTKIPKKVFRYVREDEFRHIFVQYREHLSTVYTTKPMDETPHERQLRKDVDQLAARLRSKMWFENYVTTPFHSAQWMFTKSQLNLLLFQKKYRGQWWMEGLRYFCVGLIGCLTLLSISQIANRKNNMFLFIAVGIMVYLLYLFFIQKMNEERYLMPLLPVMLLLGMHRLMSIIHRFRG